METEPSPVAKDGKHVGYDDLQEADSSTLAQLVATLESQQRMVERAVSEQRRALEAIRQQVRPGASIFKEKAHTAFSGVSGPYPGSEAADKGGVMSGDTGTESRDTNVGPQSGGEGSEDVDEAYSKGAESRNIGNIRPMPSSLGTCSNTTEMSLDDTEGANATNAALSSGIRCLRPIRRRLASREFDIFCTLVMLLNIVSMIIRLEFDGMVAGELVGELSNTGVTNTHLKVMDDVEAGFTIWFAAELVLRYWALGMVIFRDPLGLFDVFIVVSTLVDFALTRVFKVSSINLSVARLIRMLKVMKFFRTFKAASAFSELRILLKTVLRSTMALVWTMVVLTMIILAGSNFQAQLLMPYIMDEAKNLESRVWVFKYYGSAGRSAYTMLEATLSGCWPNYARDLVMEVSPLWAVFWIFYVFAVIFAVIRVMGALFLAASLKAANEDEDTQAIRRMRDSKMWTSRLKGIFLDHEGKHKHLESGKTMMRADLERVLRSRKSLDRLANFGLEGPELKLLFNILSHDGNAVNFQAFLKASLRLKGGVKAIDVIELLQEVQAIKKKLIKNNGKDGMPVMAQTNTLSVLEESLGKDLPDMAPTASGGMVPA
mmetsp:Transcript_44464/g.105366  ORF Transcript_44464/g.105366 Transcript_44464/m.105366 type:complete len:602 (-) Transcript_44464:46-1851(-)